MARCHSIMVLWSAICAQEQARGPDEVRLLGICVLEMDGWSGVRGRIMLAINARPKRTLSSTTSFLAGERTLRVGTLNSQCPFVGSGSDRNPPPVHKILQGQRKSKKALIDKDDGGDGHLGVEQQEEGPLLKLERLEKVTSARNIL